MPDNQTGTADIDSEGKMTTTGKAQLPSLDVMSTLLQPKNHPLDLILLPTQTTKTETRVTFVRTCAVEAAR